MVDLSAYAYSVRPENIAMEPAEVRLGRRDLGRLLVVERSSGQLNHSFMQSFPDWLSDGDVLVLNDCKRIPGVLRGRTDSGAQVELRFVRVDGSEGLCRIFPRHALAIGTEITAGGERFVIVADNVTPHGLYTVRAEADVRVLLVRAGLPITSFFYSGFWKIENYNNCYASEEGSVESPMAGLHFTPELLARVAQRGVKIAYLTLHPVGSWLSVEASAGSSEPLLSEPFRIPESTADSIADARRGGGRLVACGTTVVRALETAAKDDGSVTAGEGVSTLRIQPGHRFKVVDVYFTNFHPSSSSLMALDAAFCERTLLLKAYNEASEAGYLFYEFGDAVLYL